MVFVTAQGIESHGLTLSLRVSSSELLLPHIQSSSSPLSLPSLQLLLCIGISLGLRRIPERLVLNSNQVFLFFVNFFGKLYLHIHLYTHTYVNGLILQKL